MKESFESGKEKCLTQTGSIVLTDKTSGRHCYAKLNRMSCRSMYFEAEGAFKPGNMINIRFDNPPFKGFPKIINATVYWCMLLSEDEAISSYGLGVKYR